MLEFRRRETLINYSVSCHVIKETSSCSLNRMGDLGTNFLCEFLHGARIDRRQSAYNQNFYVLQYQKHDFISTTSFSSIILVTLSQL